MYLHIPPPLSTLIISCLGVVWEARSNFRQAGLSRAVQHSLESESTTFALCVVKKQHDTCIFRDHCEG